ncbi:MAG TPA: hypothetical protein VGG83_15090 [Trebonia sp.]
MKTTAPAAGLLAALRASGTVLVSARVTSTCAVAEPVAGAGMRALTMSMESTISVVVMSDAAVGAEPVPISTGAGAPLDCWPQAARARTTPGGYGHRERTERRPSAAATERRLDVLVRRAGAADEAGLDVFALREHHRPDFALSALEMVLGAIASTCPRSIQCG